MDAEVAREQELFQAALQIADAAGREAFLKRACDDNPGLRARISKLLDAHAHSENFFQECVSDFATAEEDLSPVPDPDVLLKFSEGITECPLGAAKG